VHSKIGSFDKDSTVSSLITQSRPSAVLVAWLKSTPPGICVLGLVCCLAAFVITERRELIEDTSEEEVDGSDINSISSGNIDDISSSDK